ncbi:ERCC4 domain-containing protein [Giardia muris]|uniref:ERCC4 domain-containing protein n=1 Tax=Giardia muris TaxID=5742 RepID=A0A4Z1SV95_GIAMU|nr:ERCC4 domain-containing protein [Giardia muris]|eukprot:TNJ27508.1 ERCC4 domain-containing protein [Giardia muris]
MISTHDGLLSEQQPADPVFDEPLFKEYERRWAEGAEGNALLALSSGLGLQGPLQAILSVNPGRSFLILHQTKSISRLLGTVLKGVRIRSQALVMRAKDMSKALEVMEEKGEHVVCSLSVAASALVYGYLELSRVNGGIILILTARLNSQAHLFLRTCREEGCRLKILCEDPLLLTTVSLLDSLLVTRLEKEVIGTLQQYQVTGLHRLMPAVAKAFTLNRNRKEMVIINTMDAETLAGPYTPDQSLTSLILDEIRIWAKRHYLKDPTYEGLATRHLCISELFDDPRLALKDVYVRHMLGLLHAAEHSFDTERVSKRHQAFIDSLKHVPFKPAELRASFQRVSQALNDHLPVLPSYLHKLLGYIDATIIDEVRDWDHLRTTKATKEEGSTRLRSPPQSVVLLVGTRTVASSIVTYLSEQMDVEEVMEPERTQIDRDLFMPTSSIQQRLLEKGYRICADTRIHVIPTIFDVPLGGYEHSNVSTCVSHAPIYQRLLQIGLENIAAIVLVGPAYHAIRALERLSVDIPPRKRRIPVYGIRKVSTSPILALPRLIEQLETEALKVLSSQTMLLETALTDETLSSSQTMTRFVFDEPEGPHRLLVDTRELRSDVPLALRLQSVNLVLVVRQLTLGDFIISNRRAVERKAEADLVASLRLQRLMKQAERLTEQFEDAYLVCEIPAHKPHDCYLLDRQQKDLQVRGGLVAQLLGVFLALPIKLLWATKRTLPQLLLRLKKQALAAGEKEHPITKQTEATEITTRVIHRAILRTLPTLTTRERELLLEHFPNPLRILLAPPSDLESYLPLQKIITVDAVMKSSLKDVLPLLE